MPSLNHSEILGTPLQARFDWPDENACARAAQRLAAQWIGEAASGTAVSALAGTLTLEGPLGAGKSAFCRHLLQALGVTGRIKSPTYSLVEPYEVTLPSGVLPLAHCDFYRFEDPSEWEDAGLRELFSQASIRLVEWPARAEGRLGVIDLAVFIDPMVPAASAFDDPTAAGSADDDTPSARRGRAIAYTRQGERWLASLATPS